MGPGSRTGIPGRWLVVVPVLTALAALGGASLDTAPGVVVAAAFAVGAGAAAVLGMIARRRSVGSGTGGAEAGGSRSVDLAEARRVDAIRRDFVTNASHELKTPVASIQALSESLLLAIDRDPERARGMIDRLGVESARLASMVRDLLDLARLEEMAAARSRTPVDVAEVVRRQVERVAPLAQERGIDVRTDVPEEAVVPGLPEDIRLIVGNLLENAVLYNRQGGAVVVTATDGDGQVVVSVADTGLGIEEAERARVFERFYRVDEGRSRGEGGTGLGLSLVRHAVQRAGGRIALDSVRGEGSTFTVTLPRDPPA